MNPQQDQNQNQDLPGDTNYAQSSSHRDGQSPTIVPERTNPIANVARHQANQIYQQAPPNQLAEQPARTDDDNPYRRTHQPTYDWQQYHSAWQQYYQQYYERYYLHWINAQQAQLGQNNPSEQAVAVDATVSSNVPYVPKTRFQELRDDLLSKVGERARKLQKSNHFVAIACALIIVFLFIFLQFNRLIVAQVERYISPGSTVNTNSSIIVDPASNAGVSSDPRIIIPKINVDAPVIYNVTTVDDKVIQAAMEHGVVHYNIPGASSVPGQAGNVVILGHSSNDVFDPGNYKFAFVLIDRLQPGDIFYMNYQSKRYAYRVTGQKTISPSNWQALQPNNGKPNVILVTGTPAGTATNRLLVYGEQISPDPSMASAQPANNHDSNPASIPGNSPTFFERIQSIIFPQ